ncbi:MAG TPA: monovalent cation/H(+) antiporter subunit G [Alphaproteobacteria bacterium]|nr:monovalent cation/H(+) antiporter subunit G [Alphaproteobacteria bacterium]
MAQILSSSLFLIGVAFMLIAAIGVVRMPDIFMRLHCSTKSATLGVGCVMLGAALHFGEFAIWARAIAVVAFIFVTAPVAGHILGRAAYLARAPLWEGTLSDELHGCYSPETHLLHSPPDHLRPDVEQETGR